MTEIASPAETRLERDGTHADVPDTEYHADRSALSCSGARLLLPPSTPAAFRWYMDHPRKSKREWDFGHMAHRLLLGAGAELCVLEPAVHGLTKGGTIAKSPRATDTWKEAEATARAEGRVPVHVDDYRMAQAMADKVREHPTAGPLFNSGSAEVSLAVTDPETGVRLKARPDWIVTAGNRLTIVDYKTAVSSEPNAFSRKAPDYGYHIQDVWYRRVAQLLKLDDDPRFLFVVQEKEAPYEVSVLEYQDPIDKAESKRQMREAISIYQRCSAEGKWPGRAPEITPIFLPQWACGDDEMDI
ncbi:recE [Mycobacteroides abscessus subsp. abscessus]|uniref:PD-(D/E)XK nuclease-like domain-containing protein n=1 Tax=Mycobacteroides abscessus TaxID=36809 RepID=UPI0009259B4C|nr:PD-(D/E)XK nuclease-like domain-containing protein [Mycobacteroides abscessus]SIG07254.1 recE [Mycobacteroides abscessus subsp. abscessus]